MDQEKCFYLMFFKIIIINLYGEETAGEESEYIGMDGWCGVNTVKSTV